MLVRQAPQEWQFGRENAVRANVLTVMDDRAKKKNYVNFPNIFGISEYLNDKYWECFKAHDNMYGIYRLKLYPQVKSRLEADELMYQCLVRKACPKLLAGFIYYAVRLFGARFWNIHGRKIE